MAMAVAVTLFTLLLVSVARGKFVIKENSITVTSPWTATQKSYTSAIGNFGTVPSYGGTLLGKLVYPKDNPTGCSSFSFHFKKPNPGELPTILLTDRGDCFFAKKAWHAQQAGAAAVLVADDKPEPLITMDEPAGDAESFTLLHNITIPSALIEQNFGDQLKKWLEQNTGQHGDFEFGLERVAAPS